MYHYGTKFCTLPTRPSGVTSRNVMKPIDYTVASGHVTMYGSHRRTCEAAFEPHRVRLCLYVCLLNTLIVGGAFVKPLDFSVPSFYNTPYFPCESFILQSKNLASQPPAAPSSGCSYLFPRSGSLDKRKYELLLLARLPYERLGSSCDLTLRNTIQCDRPITKPTTI